MTKREAIPQTFILDAEAEISIIYEVFPKRIEECHGNHEFDEADEVNRELISFKILLDDGEIDLTSRLTEEEKNKIVQTKLDV
jgi:hypothetical protein